MKPLWIGSLVMMFILGAVSLARSQVVIETIDQAQRPNGSGTVDMGSQDAGEVEGQKSEIEIVRGVGWGYLDESDAATPTRKLALMSLELGLDACLQRTAQPGEAELSVRYQVTRRNQRVVLELVDLQSNLEIHIGDFEFRLIRPTLTTTPLSVEPAARQFRSCLERFEFTTLSPDREPAEACISLEARYGASKLIFEDIAFQSGACAAP